jgi:hypothetical protein
MDNLGDMARDPKQRRRFEKLLYLACKRGDADLVSERLGWGVDPNCTFGKGTSPLMANIRASCPSVATVRALLKAGADATHIDEAGLSVLDYARRKLAKLDSMPRETTPSPSLDENGQLQLSDDEQAEVDAMRKEVGNDREFMRMWWQERLRAARRVFNDPGELRKIVELLESLSDSSASAT